MSLFHMHTWVTTGRDYVPPPAAPLKVQSYDEDLIRNVIYGFTTISQRCSVCGREDTYHVSGHFVEEDQ